jgi:DNA modification methylase
MSGPNGDYRAFLEAKATYAPACGFSVSPDQINPMLFPFQRDLVLWALRLGRAALFEDCGLGKTPQQLEWGRHVSEHTGAPVLIFAPLAVSYQTQREGEKFGIPVRVVKRQSDIGPGINVTNYAKLEHFTPDGLAGLVLDESSILKGFDGKTRKSITDFGRSVPYRLACTATPAPNDYMELGNHAEFLGVMTLQEMLSMFFVHDGGDTSKWRLKGHAVSEFWKWVCSWAAAIRKPADLGYDDDGFTLPPLHMHQITVTADAVPDGFLFAPEGNTLQERHEARRNSIAERVAACSALVNGDDEKWIVWCNLNAESGALAKSIPTALEVRGSHSDEFKEEAILRFVSDEPVDLISKPVMFGYGLNLQCSSRLAFVGLSDSYEQFYQAVRRSWRFGQTRPVHCYIITADTEGPVVRNIERKEKQAMEMMDGMVGHMKAQMNENVRGTQRQAADYRNDAAQGERWQAILGDCVEETNKLMTDSVDYSIFSPPFASLYTYSNSERDMGNAKDFSEFAKHFEFLCPDLFRVLKPGRLLSFHCMNLPITKERDGVIGIRDFRGDLIRIFQAAGFIYHSEVVIWKDPVTAMQRTKALGLLHRQIKKDSAMSRQGIPDYLVTMRKPGINPDPVCGALDDYIGEMSDAEFTKFCHSEYRKRSEFFGKPMSFDDFKSVMIWQRYASPVWMDINPSNTLQRESAREERDERHICPLQLQVIERAVQLWTLPGDLVLSPFMGIASEGYVAIKKGRRFIGIELKQSYYNQAVKNLQWAETVDNEQPDLFSGMPVAEQ